MNDKLSLFVKPDEYFINRANNKLTFQESRIKEPSGNETIRVKSYYNSDLFNLDENGFGLVVRFNPNKVNQIPIATSISYAEWLNSIEQINNELGSIGIDCNLLQARISRHDESFDIPLLSKYRQYEPLIKTITLSGRIRKSSKNIFENTLYLGNKSKQIIIYDKTKESGLNANIARFEIRYLKCKNLKLSAIKESNFYSYRIKSHQEIEQNIFWMHPEILNAENDTTKLLISLFESVNPYYNLPDIYRIFTLVEISNAGIFMPALLTVARHEKEYKRNSRFLTQLANTRFMKDTLYERYIELKTTFRKAV